MGDETKIEWCDRTMNFWVGCTKVTPACDFCYAETWAKRCGKPELWQGERRRTSAANWRKPRKWDLEAAFHGRRDKVFSNSLSDFFDNQIDPQWRADAWKLIGECRHLDWLILTKRPENIKKMLPPDWGEHGYPNVWLGTTVEDQQRANHRIPHLLSVPARVHFLSCEPLLGPIDLRNIKPKDRYEVDALTGMDFDSGELGERLHWIIAGGESGGKARPSNPDHIRSLRDQCAATSTPFLFKQFGEWGEARTRVGKKRAGRLLDGVLHDGYPAPTA